MLKYKKVKRIGQGAHGTVTKCKTPHKKTEFVAVKKMKLLHGSENQGLGPQILRELHYVQRLTHPNIVKLIDVVRQNRALNLVYEFVDSNLESILHDGNVPFTEAHAKHFLRLLLKAVAFCHSNWILHRDIKPSNCLVSASGDLKLADFGLAKSFGSEDQRMSPEACTLWYRAPELLFGARYYGEAMDMWSVGCVFGEMLLRKVVFPGNRSAISQLSSIFALLGTPTEGSWPNVVSLPCFFEFEKTDAVDLKNVFVDVSGEAIDLFEGLCALNPLKRLTAAEALEHPYFKSPPRERKLCLQIETK